MEGAEDWSNVYGIDLAQAQATTWLVSVNLLLRETASFMCHLLVIACNTKLIDHAVYLTINIQR